MTISAFCNAVTTIVWTVVDSWMSMVVEFICSKPLILVPFVCFFFVGGVVALVNRLLRGQ